VVGQIKELERVLGSRLLDRTRGRRGVTLTAAGQPLFAAGGTAFAALREGSAAIEALRAPVRASVSLGVTPGFGGEVLPRLYTEFQRLRPDVDVRVTIDRRAVIQEALLSGRLELGVFSDPADDERLVSVPLSTYDLVLVGPPGHPFAGDVAVPFREVAAEPVVCTYQQSAPMEAMARLAAAQGVKLQIALEIDDPDTLVQAVVYGLGITALTRKRLVVAQRVADGQLAVLNVEGFPIRCEWHLGQARGPVGHEAEALRRYLIDACRESVSV
jgi:DNA-binding transcriptional LysR family regulator